MPAGWLLTTLANIESRITLETETHSLQPDDDDTKNSTTSSTTPLVVLSEDTAASESLEESPVNTKANTTAVPSIVSEFCGKKGCNTRLEQAGAECMISRVGWCKTHDIFATFLYYSVPVLIGDQEHNCLKSIQ